MERGSWVIPGLDKSNRSCDTDLRRGLKRLARAGLLGTPLDKLKVKLNGKEVDLLKIDNDKEFELMQ